MGIVNVTPDSFSDGVALGSDPQDAIDHGMAVWELGADIVDVGGESTRPGAASVSERDELARVVPVVAGLVDRGVTVSVDTSKAAVARASLEAGAEAINDVTALRDPQMAVQCAEFGAGVVLMHMQGTPQTMQDDPRYEDVVGEVSDFLAERTEAAVRAGVDHGHICIDPGIGFGKTHEHNLDLLAGLRSLTGLGVPVLVGTSRKGFLGKILDQAGHPAVAGDRDAATAATIALAIAAGVTIIRVHNVAAGLQTARTADAMVRRQGGEN